MTSSSGLPTYIYAKFLFRLVLTRSPLLRTFKLHSVRCTARSLRVRLMARSWSQHCIMHLVTRKLFGPDIMSLLEICYTFCSYKAAWPLQLLQQPISWSILSLANITSYVDIPLSVITFINHYACWQFKLQYGNRVILDQPWLASDIARARGRTIQWWWVLSRKCPKIYASFLGAHVHNHSSKLLCALCYTAHFPFI